MIREHSESSASVKVLRTVEMRAAIGVGRRCNPIPQLWEQQGSACSTSTTKTKTMTTTRQERQRQRRQRSQRSQWQWQWVGRRCRQNCAAQSPNCENRKLLHAQHLQRKQKQWQRHNNNKDNDNEVNDNDNEWEGDARKIVQPNPPTVRTASFCMLNIYNKNKDNDNDTTTMKTTTTKTTTTKTTTKSGKEMLAKLCKSIHQIWKPQATTQHLQTAFQTSHLSSGYSLRWQFLSCCSERSSLS